MSKTPEEMAEEFADLCVSDAYYAPLKAGFLAGYQAAKELYAAKLKEANDTVAGMADECEGLKTIIYDNNETNLPTPAKWISVKERLPEDGIEVLFYSPEKEMNCCFVGYKATKNEYVDPEGNGLIARQIEKYYTHWMPLPAPPKEEK